MTGPGGPGAVAVSVIVTTIGRPAELQELLDSLSGQAGRPSFELVVVDQSEDRSCLKLVESQELPFPVIGMTSERGASLGRNVGASVAVGRILTFPDDNAFYRPDTLVASLGLLGEGFAVVSGIQLTRGGQHSMLRWLPTA